MKASGLVARYDSCHLPSHVKMHGYGQMVVRGVLDHNATYNGFFSENIEEGDGCMRYMDGHVYTGQTVQGLRSMWNFLRLVYRDMPYSRHSLLLCLDSLTSDGVGSLEYGRDRFNGEWVDGRRQGQVDLSLETNLINCILTRRAACCLHRVICILGSGIETIDVAWGS